MDGGDRQRRQGIWRLVLVLGLAVALTLTTPRSAQARGEGMSDEAVRRAIIAESIARYPSVCACPYSVMRNGAACGARSAYSRPGGHSPLCYPQDATRDMLMQWRARRLRRFPRPACRHRRTARRGHRRAERRRGRRRGWRGGQPAALTPLRAVVTQGAVGRWLTAHHCVEPTRCCDAHEDATGSPPPCLPFAAARRGTPSPHHPRAA